MARNYIANVLNLLVRKASSSIKEGAAFFINLLEASQLLWSLFPIRFIIRSNCNKNHPILIKPKIVILDQDHIWHGNLLMRPKLYTAEKHLHYLHLLWSLSLLSYSRHCCRCEFRPSSSNIPVIYSSRVDCSTFLDMSINSF